jgi:predicted Co/Zn/Cd cation transporter (cation efflux family)
LNVALSALKISAGVFGHSQAVLADGIHSISDTVTEFAVIIGSYYFGQGFRTPATHMDTGGLRHLLQCLSVSFLSVPGPPLDGKQLLR